MLLQDQGRAQGAEGREIKNHRAGNNSCPETKKEGNRLYGTPIKIFKKDFNWSPYETCFVISFLINHKTGSAVRRCLNSIRQQPAGNVPGGLFFVGLGNPLPNLRRSVRFSLTAAVSISPAQCPGRDRRQRTPAAPCPVPGISSERSEW